MAERNSIWTEELQMPERQPLSGDLKVDAAVIGGGMAGILTAHFLSRAGLHTVVLEANRTGSGQTGNTTAKITSQHGLIYDHLLYRFGEERAWQYAMANEGAIAQYAGLIKEKQIDCDFVSCGSYLYAEEDWESIAREYEAAQRLGIESDYCEATELPFPVERALLFHGQAHFHPIKFLKAIAEPLEIYEHTKVLDVEASRIKTTRGTVTAEQVIFCSHYPFLNIPGYYFLRMHQERSYVLALRNAGYFADMYYGVDKGGLSLRMQGDLLLLGGESHRTGENTEGGKYQRLRQTARRYWPDCQEAAAWSAQDCISMDGIPYIGRFSAAVPNWYVATGFRKWGMTSSMAAAVILSDLITCGESPWADVFSPGRFSFSASAVSLLQDTVQAAKGLMLGAVNAHVRNPKREDGLVSRVLSAETKEAPRCPHMGCLLTWNPDEKTWDCPCHGSRFDANGSLLEGPALQHVGETEELPEKKVAAEALSRFGRKLRIK